MVETRLIASLLAGNYFVESNLVLVVLRAKNSRVIEVGTGKKVRLFVLNAGPSEDSSFHIVGTIFNRVIKEGVELTSPNKGGYGSQAVDLAPAEGAIIELTTKRMAFIRLSLMPLIL